MADGTAADRSAVARLPGIVQWLALVDEKQEDALVRSCLSRLIGGGGGMAPHGGAGGPAPLLMQEAMATPSLRRIMEGLRPETKWDMLSRMAGIPAGWKVR